MRRLLRVIQIPDTLERSDPITREQMVVMMYRYADYKKYDISKNGRSQQLF